MDRARWGLAVCVTPPLGQCLRDSGNRTRSAVTCPLDRLTSTAFYRHRFAGAPRGSSLHAGLQTVLTLIRVIFVAFSALLAHTDRAFVHALRSPAPVALLGARRAARFPWWLSPLGARLLRRSGFRARTVSRETGPRGSLMFHVKRAIEGEFGTARGTAKAGLGGPFAKPCTAVFHVKRVARRARVSRETGIVPPKRSPNVAREPRHENAAPSHPPLAAFRTSGLVAGHHARSAARSWRVDGRGGIDDGRLATMTGYDGDAFAKSLVVSEGRAVLAEQGRTGDRVRVAVGIASRLAPMQR